MLKKLLSIILVVFMVLPLSCKTTFIYAEEEGGEYYEEEETYTEEEEEEEKSDYDKCVQDQDKAACRAIAKNAQSSLKDIEDQIANAKENRELGETIDRYMDGLILLEHTPKVLDVLSCGRTPKRDGKGNPYVDVINHKMPILEAMQTASRRAFRRAFG